jgi:predicted Ser/Thr protein kinase
MAPNLLNERYHLLATIAGGGMAVVYKAQDRLLNRIVAIKVLRSEYAQDPAFLASFRQEAQAAANLTHPNIVTIFDVGQDGDRHYIVMEYVEGRDLKTIIQEEAPFSIGRALDITVDVCAAVGFAHRAGIVHCDVKPQNVLISHDGRVKVTDFGIARAFFKIEPGEIEMVWGTPHYFAPEQAAGEPPTPASDVYSIGIMLFEMLAGRLPFDASDHSALAAMHMQNEPPPLHRLNPQVPLQLEQIVRKVLSKEPAGRYRSADHLGRILSAYRQGSSQVTGFRPPVVPASPEAGAAPRVTKSGVRERPTTRPASRPERVTRRPKTGTDWQLWFLGAVAALAVLGLIPLWAVVYRTYADLGEPTPTPLVTQSVTPIPGTTIVPQFVGLSREAAQQEALQANLGLIVEERDDPEHPLPTVLEQDPPAGRSVPAASQVKLVVSRPVPSSAIPDVLGYGIDQVREGLQSRGWTVVTENAWSGEPVGRVLSVAPPIGTMLAAGQRVTLTLSAGTDQPLALNVNLNNMILLESAILFGERFAPGDNVPVVLRWRALQPIADAYTVFFHLLGPGGGLMDQDDHGPRSGDINLPTNEWTPGVIIEDRHTVAIPSNAGNGVYQLRTGMYLASDDNRRLPVLDAGETSQQDNSILVREIRVGP